MNSPRLSRYLAGVRCFACETPHDPHQLLTVCTKCARPLRVDYDLSRVRLRLRDLQGRPPSLWRYREVLPLEEGDEVSTLPLGIRAQARLAQCALSSWPLPGAVLVLCSPTLIASPAKRLD
jgi:threonine synthase